MSLLFSAKRKNINLSTPHQTLMQNARRWLEKCCEEQKPQLCRTWGKPLRHCIYIALLIPIVCGIGFSPAAAALTVPSLLFVSVGGVMTYLCLRFLRNPMKTLRSLGPVMILMALVFSPFATVAGGVFLLGMLPLATSCRLSWRFVNRHRTVRVRRLENTSLYAEGVKRSGRRQRAETVY